MQPEPFFITFALYDVKESRKISEDFHFDPNEGFFRNLIESARKQHSNKPPTTDSRSRANSSGSGGAELNGTSASAPTVSNVEAEKLKYLTRVRFNTLCL